MSKILNIVVGTVAGAIVALGASACAGASLSQVPSTSTGGGGQATPAASQSTTNTGPVGTTFSVTGTDDNGNKFTYQVTLMKVDASAQPDNEFDSAQPGDYLAAAEFQIKGMSGTASDDANNDAVAVGSDEQSYQSGIEGVADGTNFDSGQFNVAAGQASVGWVTFDVKNGVTVSSVKWTPQSGFGGASGTWTV